MINLIKFFCLFSLISINKTKLKLNVTIKNSRFNNEW